MKAWLLGKHRTIAGEDGTPEVIVGMYVDGPRDHVHLRVQRPDGAVLARHLRCEEEVTVL